MRRLEWKEKPDIFGGTIGCHAPGRGSAEAEWFTTRLLFPDESTRKP
jgi:hypothetical protein